MKKILFVLVLLFLVGCTKPVVEEITVVEDEVVVVPEAEVRLAIDILERSMHKFIVGAKPEGIFISFNVEITNLGVDVVNITQSDAKLIDSDGNEYALDEGASAYTRNSLRELIIHPGNDASARLVFDIPDSDGEFTLSVKGKEVRV